VFNSRNILMPDYRRPLQFGFFLDPSASNPGRTLEIAHLIEEAGFDLIGIQDHPYRHRHFDTMALIGVILGQTSRIRVFPDVANLPLRAPAMLAKSAATLDLLTGGRFELGLGAGAFWDAIKAMGGPGRTPGESVRSLREGIELIRQFWTARSVRYDGEFYSAMGARPGPMPAREIGIWLGVYGPRMLELTGALADGWVPSMPYAAPEKTIAMNAAIDTAASAAGRDVASIRRIYNIGGDVSPVLESGESPQDTQIVGPISFWIETLTRLATDYGFDTFVWMATPTGPRLKMFMDEIAPAVRERVETIRAARG
jgi:alkanesulfonate monooxygenase SsuD/methylene tetrahydromethanopterin reductase-like flavin-dependent oxidoreductase (luciferase family)